MPSKLLLMPQQLEPQAPQLLRYEEIKCKETVYLLRVPSVLTGMEYRGI
jgi:hypothetical protein